MTSRKEKKEILRLQIASGKLYIGVQDDGTVVGLDDPDGAALQVMGKACACMIMAGMTIYATKKPLARREQAGESVDVAYAGVVETPLFVNLLL